MCPPLSAKKRCFLARNHPQGLSPSGTLMRCSSCGSDNREGRKFCAECGATLSLACAACGAKQSAGRAILRRMREAAGRSREGIGAARPSLLHPEAPRREDPHLPQRPRRRAQAGDGPLRRREGLDGARRAARPRGVAQDHGSLLPDPRRGRPPLRGHGQPVHAATASWRCSARRSRTKTTRSAPATRRCTCARSCAATRTSCASARPQLLRADGPQLGRGRGREDRRRPADGLHGARATRSAWRRGWSRSPSRGRPISPSTRRSSSPGYFQLRDLGRNPIKGLSEPLHVFELEGVGRRAHPPRGLPRARLLQVRRAPERDGRSGGRARAGDRGKRAGRRRRRRAGNGQEPPLLRVRRALPRAGDPRLRGARCRPREGRTLLPVLEFYRGYFGITEQDTARAARDKIAGRMLLLDETLAEGLPLMFDFLGVPDPERPAPPLGPEARQRQLSRRDPAARAARAAPASRPSSSSRISTGSIGRARSSSRTSSRSRPVTGRSCS